MTATKRFLLLLGVVCCCAAVAMAQTAPTTQFQLDGTAALNGSYPACEYGTPCDYWNLINGSGQGDGANGHSTARVFINGESSTLAFTQGGSKDFNDITSWVCSSTPTPNKDTLSNGYAAAYNATNSDLELIFGADRLSTSGDANIGVWFFQQTVLCNATTGKFSGVHQKGDIFAVSAFTQGGTIPTISVYDWDTGCATGVKNPTAGQCADSNLRLLFSAGSLCDSSGTLSTLPACAITNSATIPVSWPYPTATSATPSNVPAQALFTGGVNITYLLKTFGGLDTSGGLCFTSFLEETRSSQTTSAVLKDFIGGGFPLCGISVTKECPLCSIVANGSTFEYEVDGTVVNVGAGTAHNVVVTDGNLQFNCGDLTAKGQAGSTKIWGGGTGITADCTPLNTTLTCGTFPAGTCFDSSSNSATNVASAVAYTGSNSTGTKLTATTKTIQCGTCKVSPGLELTKECHTVVAGSPFGVKVFYDGTVHNNGNDEIDGVVVSEQDNAPIDTSGNPTGTFTPLVSPLALTKFNGTNYVSCPAPCNLAPDEKAYFGLNSTGIPNVLSYIPSIGTLVDAGRALFGDTVGASGTSLLDSKTVTAPQKTASCPLCPKGACPL
jgi:hypothetical protein